MLLALADREGTPCGRRCSDTGKANACSREHLLEKLWVRGLDDDTGVLGEEELDKVGLWDSAEIDFESTLLVSKAHLQQCGNQPPRQRCRAQRLGLHAPEAPAPK